MLWLRKKDIGKKIGVEKIYDLIHKKIKGRFETRNPINEQIREWIMDGSDMDQKNWWWKIYMHSWRYYNAYNYALLSFSTRSNWV